MSTNRSKYLPPRPSAYTPFLRWFTNERKREIADSKKLYATVSALHPKNLLKQVFVALEDRIEENGPLPPHLDEELRKVSHKLLELEDALFEIDEPKWKALSLAEAAELRMQLRAKEYFLRNKQKSIELLTETIANTLVGLADLLPGPSEHSLMLVPRCALVADIYELVELTINTFIDGTFEDTGLFADIRRQFYLNLCGASNFVPFEEHKKPFTGPREKGLSPVETVDLYLAETPFAPLLKAPIELPIPEDTFFSHMHVVGGSGAGKTSWLGQLVLHHIKNPNRPSIVVVDSQSALIPPLSTLRAIQDRLLVIDPRDPPAINVFDGEGAIEIMDYLFSGIVGAKLTPKQSVFFSFVAELMVSIPGATMIDVLSVMRDPEPYREHMATLSELARDFFENDFNTPTFRETKDQVRYRLHALLRNKSLKKILTSKRTALELDAALNSGAVVLIDTSKEYLKDVSPQFGRIFIALILRALYKRFAMPEPARHPTYLIVDEAHEYFDQNIDEFLTQARKLKCGCVFAHQYLGQCTPQLRESLAANTAIRMASGVSVLDARTLAPALRTTADFILEQQPLTFATYVRNVTAEAIPVRVTPGLVRQEEHGRVRQTPMKPRTKEARKKGEAPVTPPNLDDIDTDASDSW